MSGITVRLDGLEDLVERVVEEKVAEALAARDEKTWYTASEAAEYLGLKVSTIYDKVNDGLLIRHGAKGHRLLLSREDLDAYVESRGRQ